MLEIPDMWEILVESVFGGFWISVLGMMAIFALILALGKTSGWTILNFNLMFLFCMTAGYGYRLFTLLIFVVIMFYAVSSFWLRKLNSGGGQ
jgi:hypothetical protein